MAQKYKLTILKDMKKVYTGDYDNEWSAITDGWVKMGDLMEKNGFEEWKIAMAQEQLRDNKYTDKLNYDNMVSITASIRYEG